MSAPVLVVLCCAVVLAFDTVASLVSKVSAIPYSWFSLGQLLIYVAIGFITQRIAGASNVALLSVVAAAVTEATFGWFISAKIGPGAIPIKNITALAASAAFFLLIVTGLGSAGVWLGGGFRN